MSTLRAIGSVVDLRLWLERLVQVITERSTRRAPSSLQIHYSIRPPSTAHAGVTLPAAGLPTLLCKYMPT